MCTHAYMHTYIHTYMHAAYMHTCIHACMVYLCKTPLCSLSSIGYLLAPLGRFCGHAGGMPGTGLNHQILKQSFALLSLPERVILLSFQDCWRAYISYGYTTLQLLDIAPHPTTGPELSSVSRAEAQQTAQCAPRRNDGQTRVCVRDFECFAGKWALGHSARQHCNFKDLDRKC